MLSFKLRYCILLFCSHFLYFVSVSSQNNYTPEEPMPKTIAGNADKLLSLLKSTLEIKYTYDSLQDSDPNKDIIAKKEQKDKYDKLLSVLRRPGNTKFEVKIDNFLFGNSIPFKENPIEGIPNTLTDSLFADYYSKLFYEVAINKIIVKSLSVFTDPNYRTDYEKFDNIKSYLFFEKDKITVALKINFGTTSKFSPNIEDGNKTFFQRIIGSNNYSVDSLFLQIGWDDYKDQSSYYFRSITKDNPTILYDTLNKIIINPLKDWAKDKIKQPKYDSTYDSDFLKLFKTPEIAAIQCDLFFSKENCKDSIIISPKKFLENLKNKLGKIEKFDLTELTNQISVHKDLPDRIIYKIKPDWDYQISSGGVKNMKNEKKLIENENSEQDDDYNDSENDISEDNSVDSANISNELNTVSSYRQPIIYIELKKSRKLLNFGSDCYGDYETARILYISDEKTKLPTLIIAKKGYWTLEPQFNLNLSSIRIKDATEFDNFENTPLSLGSFTPGFALDLCYYWIKSNNRNIDFGISTGIAYNQYKHSVDYMKVNDSIENVSNILGKHTLMINGEKIGEELKLNEFEITPAFDIKYKINNNSFCNFALGINFMIPLGNNNVNCFGDSINYAGKYTIQFPNQNQYNYIVENIDEYGFNSYQLKITETEKLITSKTALQFQIKSSYAFKYNPKHNNYLKISGFVKIGSTPYTIDNNTDQLFYTDKENRGYVHNIYKHGSANMFISYGLSISMQIFYNKMLTQNIEF